MVWKGIIKQSTSKTKWGYQNPRVGSCKLDNQIEGKATKKQKNNNFKKNWILKDNKKRIKKILQKKPRPHE